MNTDIIINFKSHDLHTKLVGYVSARGQQIPVVTLNGGSIAIKDSEKRDLIIQVTCRLNNYLVKDNGAVSYRSKDNQFYILANSMDSVAVVREQLRVDLIGQYMRKWSFDSVDAVTERYLDQCMVEQGVDARKLADNILAIPNFFVTIYKLTDTGYAHYSEPDYLEEVMKELKCLERIGKVMSK